MHWNTIWLFGPDAWYSYFVVGELSCFPGYDSHWFATLGPISFHQNSDLGRSDYPDKNDFMIFSWISPTCWCLYATMSNQRLPLRNDEYWWKLRLWCGWQPLVIGQILWETLPSKCGLQRRDLIWTYPIISHVPPELLAEPKKSQWIAYSSDCRTMENLHKLMEFTSFHYQVNSKFDLHVYIFIFAYKIFSTENQFLGPTNFAGDVWQQCDGGMPPVWNQRWRRSRLSTLMCHCHAATRDLMVLPGEVLAAFVFGDETPESWDIIQHCRPWHGTPGQEAKDATRTWGTML